MMSSPAEVKIVRHIISVQAGGDNLYLLETVYPETDALNAVGKVLRAGWDSESGAQCLLNTNDTLSSLWRSPGGNLWIGSARGNVWTTADVTWPPHRMAGLRFEPMNASYQWKVTTLPNLEEENHRPNVTALWGTDDADVFAATYEGAIFRWDGRKWQQMQTGVKSGLNHLHGSGKTNVYCVGFDGVVLHYAGAQWRRVSLPGDADRAENLTGVRAIGPDKALICGRGGVILQGNDQNLTVLVRAQASFYGLAHFQGRVFLAAGRSGVWELRDQEAVVVKGNVEAVGIFESPRRLFFVEAAQEPRPSIVEYDPADTSPWFGEEF